jgi:hypothetical protein
MSTPESPEGTKPASPAPKRPAWIAGGVLILVGVVFLLTNVAGVSLDNWWALFILIPAIGSLWTAVSMYLKNDRQITAASTGPLIGGVALLAVTAIFLFNLDWGRVWPVFLIIAGAAVLLGVVRKRR